jgi:hypothetical protein
MSINILFLALRYPTGDPFSPATFWTAPRNTPPTLINSYWPVLLNLVEVGGVVWWSGRGATVMAFLGVKLLTALQQYCLSLY